MITDIPPRVTYAGDGTTRTFAYPFRIFEVTDLTVTVAGVVKAATVTGVGNIAGGTAMLATAPAAGAEVVLERDVPLSRSTDFVDGGDFRAAGFNDEFDRQIANIQELGQRIDDISVPEFPAVVAGRQLSYDAAGDLVLTQYNADDTRVIADAATALATAASSQATAALAAVAALEVEVPIRPDTYEVTLVADQTDYVLPSNWPINITAPGQYQLMVDGIVVDTDDYAIAGSDGRTIRLANAPVATPDGTAYGAGSKMRVLLLAGMLPASAVADGAITAPKLAAGAVTAAAIGTGAVETAAIQDGAVTADKEESGTAGSVRIYNSLGRPSRLIGVANKLLGFNSSGYPVNVDPPVITPQTGGLIRIITDGVAGTRNYVKSADAVWTVVELVGGGGGGAYGAATSADVQGGPGGGPSWNRKIYDSTTLAASVPYTVAAGGSAGIVGTETGGAGGTSIFLTQRAVGGAGGTRAAVPSVGTITTAGGGAGGVATGGDINEAGSQGYSLNIYDMNTNAWVGAVNIPGSSPRTGGRGGPGGSSGTRTGSTGLVTIWEFK